MLEYLESRVLLSGTGLLNDINPGTANSDASEFVQVGGTTYFVATDADNGRELWKTDGTEAGTTIVKDINAGTASSSPRNLVEMGGSLYFFAFNTTYGTELWRSNGTTSGTVLVKDIRSGTAGSNPQELTRLGSKLVFAANNLTNGGEIWISDGTAVGTAMVKDILPTGNNSPRSLTQVGSSIFFVHTDGTTGDELWKTDGTPVGTVRVKDINVGSNGSLPGSLTEMNGILYFAANGGTNSFGSLGRELWRSDGTDSGTTIIKDIAANQGNSNPQFLTNMGGTLYFSASYINGLEVLGSELWKTDGTNSGTVLVKDILPGSGSSNPTSLTAVGGALFFTANNGTIGTELWISYGTEGGTAHVRDILPGSEGSNPVNLANIDGILYFAANDGSSGIELWKTNGSISGTTLALDIAPGAGSSSPANLRKVGNDLYLTANNGVHGAEPWIVKTDAPPTDIFLNASFVAENSIAGTGVGELVATGSNASGTQFSLIPGALDNPKFTLTGNVLKTAEVFDYEAVSHYVVRVTATSAGITITRDLSIFVGAVNEFDPQLTSPLGHSVAENTLTAATFSATDLDSPTPSFTYSIAGGADAAQFTISGNRLSFAASPNFEAPADADGDNEYTVQIAVSDGSRSQTSTLVVSVTDVNEAPTNITLSNLAFAESLPAGSVVGTLAATDVDGPDPISFTFAAITPNDNVDFEIVGNQLRTTREFDFETPADQQLLLRIVASDALSATSLPAVFNLTVTDAPERPIANNLILNTNRNSGVPVTLGSDVATPIFAITQHPRHGTLSGTAPNLTYLPSSNFVGDDEFFYTVSGNGLTSFEARVAITVIGVKPTVNFSFGGLGVGESSGTVNLRVNLSEPAEQDLVVSFQIQPRGTATEDLDFYAPQSLLIKKSESSRFTTLTIIDDPVDEPLEYFTIAIVASPEYTLGSKGTLPVTISDNDDAPVVSWTVNSSTVTESAGTVSTKIRLNAPATQDIIIPFTVGGTATGSDFGPVTPAGSTITIASGQTEAIFSIPITNDDQPEPTETIVIELGTPSYGQISSLLSDRRLTLTVRDDDLAEISMTRSFVSVGENAGTIQVTATINVAQATTLTVPFQLGGNATFGGINADYMISSSNQGNCTSKLALRL